VVSFPRRLYRIFRHEGLDGLKVRSRQRLQAWFPGWENRRWVKRFSPDSEELDQKKS